MASRRRTLAGLVLPTLCGMALAATPPSSAGEPAAVEDKELEPLVVTASRQPAQLLDTIGNDSRIERPAIELVGATHINELMFQAPGTWITRGSGQESLTAIRSPVLTGAGSCGAFLIMENGVPLRPAGFCNVNQLFEVNSEQADAIEVVRGPMSNLYGSNALHGAINVLTGSPLATRRFSAEAGSDDYYRGEVDVGRIDGGHGERLLLLGTHFGGFRHASGYDQFKLNFSHARRLQQGELRVDFAATYLDQQTAGFIRGKNAYQHAYLRRSNPDPDAFRDANAQRLVANWSRDIGTDLGLDLRAYARRSRMKFLQHFLPGDPLERNGQNSGGLMLSLGRQSAGALSWLTGVDLEYMSGYLEEYQDEPITEGSEFLQATRPAGKHYDYDVDQWLLAPWAQLQGRLSQRLSWMAAARVEYLYYDYQNNMLTGNTDDQGRPCDFGGCLFFRPGDRSDDFLEIAPKIGLSYALGDDQQAYVTFGRGFRMPQATELYRLQRQQEVDDIDPVEMDSLEAGWRWLGPHHALELVGFYMKKRDQILRDADGINVNAGRTLHRGVEFDTRLALNRSLTLAATGTYARHSYDFDRLLGGGESIEDGDDVDTAPRRLGSLRLQWQFLPGGLGELEWLHMGSYELDAANDHDYGGHDLLNLRLKYRLTPRWQVGIRVTNLTNEAYAERADFAFGNYRYFPGMDRATYLRLTYIGD